MDRKSRPDTLLLAFIACSLLLHLLVIFLLPQRELFPLPDRPEPIIVDLRPPTPVPPRQRELDLPVRPPPEKPRETAAKRLGPTDQVVRKETAPKGNAPENRRPSPPPSAATRPPSVPPASQPEPDREPPAEPAPARPAAPETAEPTAPRPLPDLNALTQLPPSTVARLEQQWEKEWRKKYGPEVGHGDTYWLDTEKDILISFFQRFRNNIYAVWSYPAKSRDRGEEGVCLLKVTVNSRDGSLRDVQVVESSGFPRLDDEAADAVRKAAPFGEVHRFYQEETISIFAFFQYNLTRMHLRRPGSIY